MHVDNFLNYGCAVATVFFTVVLVYQIFLLITVKISKYPIPSHELRTTQVKESASNQALLATLILLVLSNSHFVLPRYHTATIDIYEPSVHITITALCTGLTVRIIRKCKTDKTVIALRSMSA